MATYEHSDGRDFWFFEALVESAKLNQMAINDEAAHRNKPHCRVQQGWRVNPDGTPVEYDLFDQEYTLILQGVATIGSEALPRAQPTHLVVPYPSGPGVGPFLRRPIPIVHAMNAQRAVAGASTPDQVNYQEQDFDDYNTSWPNYPGVSTPQANVGFTDADAGTDFRTSLPITVHLANNLGSPLVFPEGPIPLAFVFWRTIGHVAPH